MSTDGLVSRSLVNYACPTRQELATAFHWFYERCRVTSSKASERPLTDARLKLVEATQTVF